MKDNLLLKINDVPIKKLIFKNEGFVPNSKLPVLVYEGVIDFGELGQKDAEKQIDELVSNNNWYRDWTYPVYPFLHYHSTAHEGLVIFSGQVSIQLGGKNGKIIQAKKGDMIIIPAGVGHERLLESEDVDQRQKEIEQCLVFGIYPDGQKWDFISEHPEVELRDSKKLNDPQVKIEAMVHIEHLPKPTKDPVYGRGHLVEEWMIGSN